NFPPSFWGSASPDWIDGQTVQTVKKQLPDGAPKFTSCRQNCRSRAGERLGYQTKLSKRILIHQPQVIKRTAAEHLKVNGIECWLYFKNIEPVLQKLCKMAVFLMLAASHSAWTC
ncbi:unnamed protein product, partial [Caretta caretta]